MYMKEYEIVSKSNEQKILLVREVRRPRDLTGVLAFGLIAAVIVILKMAEIIVLLQMQSPR